MLKSRKNLSLYNITDSLSYLINIHFFNLHKFAPQERLNAFVQTDFHPLRLASAGRHAGQPCALLGTPCHVCEGLFHFKIARSFASSPLGNHSFHDRRMFPRVLSVNSLATGCSCREQKTGELIGRVDMTQVYCV
ncbi:hypothetical protein CDAR_217911 [Caerostris darwini]|uniref:Uncharacterized protein n=1 Tax=Caerostris darwini TaxID=1538125 RepID=A0AAV4VNH4_9ARAC|nr:hypothetical protein CDAR_217911 [Caerostris darwini]